MDIHTPSIILLSAAPGSGKSYMIKYLLKILSSKGRFSGGLVFTNTAFNDDYNYLPAKCVSMYSEEKLKRFLRFQRECADAGTLKPMFLVLDDILGSINFQSSLWTSVITTFRHYKITIFISSQYIFKLNPTIRACASYCFIFAPKEGRSVDALCETFGFGHSKEEFKSLLLNNTGNYYAVLVNNLESDVKKRFTKVKAPGVGPFKIQF